MAKHQHILKRTWLLEDARMGTNAHDTRQHLWRDGVGRRTIHNLFQPSPIGFVLVSVGSKGVNENVYVRQNQLRPSIRSNVAALSAMSTPRWVPPPARQMGNSTRCRSDAFCDGLRINASRPCSIIAVSVIPRRAASPFARSSNSSLSRICSSHMSKHIYKYVYMSIRTSRPDAKAISMESWTKRSNFRGA